MSLSSTENSSASASGITIIDAAPPAPIGIGPWPGMTEPGPSNEWGAPTDHGSTDDGCICICRWLSGLFAICCAFRSP